MENDLRPRLISVSPELEKRRALRGFGCGLGLILFYFAWRAYARGNAPIPLAALGLTSLVLAGVWPAFFGPVFRLWMPVVGVLARINLWLLCGILYYGVVTPWSLFIRLLGFHPLELALGEKDSYWEEKEPRDPAESSRRIF